MRTIIVTGAGGWIGREVSRRLQETGWTVVGLDLESASGVPGVRMVPLDLLAPDGGEGDWRGELPGSVGVIHCAGYAHRAVESEEEVRRFDAINRKGTELVVSACEASRVPRFTYLSTIAVYGRVQPGSAREDGPVAAVTAYAKSKLAGERAVTRSKLDWRVVRLATVFGEGDRANFWKLAQALRRRRFVLPGRGEARKSAIPIDLAREIIAEMSVRREVPHRIVNLALPVAPSLAEIVRGFSEVCGFPAPLSVPLWIMRRFAAIGDLIAKRRPAFPLTTNSLRKLSESTGVDVDRLVEMFPRREWPRFAAALGGHREWYTGERGNSAG